MLLSLDEGRRIAEACENVNDTKLLLNTTHRARKKEVDFL